MQRLDKLKENKDEKINTLRLENNKIQNYLPLREYFDFKEKYGNNHKVERVKKFVKPKDKYQSEMKRLKRTLQGMKRHQKIKMP